MLTPYVFVNYGYLEAVVLDPAELLLDGVVVYPETGSQIVLNN